MPRDPEPIKPRLVLFFTWDVSLALWQEKGLLQREVRYYEALAAQGVDVTFLTWGDSRDADIGKTLKGIQVVPIYSYIACSANKILRALSSFTAPWAVRRFIKRAHILKTNQMWGGWYAVIAKFMFGKPLVVRTGFELYRFTLQEKRRLPRRLFIWLISFLTYKAARRVYLATEEDKEFVIDEFNIEPDRIAIRPNWIDVNFFRPLSEPEKDNHILFVGRLTAQKNLPLLLAALRGAGWTLDIVGAGELEVDLRQQAQDLGVKVNFLGSLPNDALPALYNRYPVFVLPSLYEGNPKTLLEAMACGRAVIGTDVDGIKSVVHDGESGILCNPVADDLRAAIALLMNDKGLRATLGENARRQIVETQSLEKLIGAEVADYETLLEP